MQEVKAVKPVGEGTSVRPSVRPSLEIVHFKNCKTDSDKSVILAVRHKSNVKI